MGTNYNQSNQSESVPYHVLPLMDRGWGVQRDGERKPLVAFSSKAEAILAGNSIAQASGNVRLVIHAKDFTVESEWVYSDESVSCHTIR